MERLTHRKRRGLEAVAMGPAANLPQFEIARGHLHVFMSESANAKLCGKNAAPPREKIAFEEIPLLHFPAFARNMGCLGIGAPRWTGRGSGSQPRVYCPSCHGRIIVRGVSAGDSCGKAGPRRSGDK
jgi:hypothetical protein